MDLINKIGQRRLSIILFIVAIVICIIEFGIKKGFNDVMSIKFTFAAILFSGASGILSVAAHKTREYRLVAIVLSFVMILINAILFYLNVIDFLFIITVCELIFSIVFTIFLFAIKPKKVQKIKSATKTTTKKDDSN